MRSPSVTTIIATSRCGQLRRSSFTWPRSSAVTKIAARPLEDVAELLAREAHRRRVDDRHHLVGVLGDDAKEQRLVAVVQRGQEDVFLERVVEPAKVAEDAATCSAWLHTCGGSSPFRPSASRSASLNAVPLFSSGFCSSVMPRGNQAPAEPEPG